MNGKTKLLAGIALVLVAFLLGFVPQYLQTTRLRSELNAANEQVVASKRDVKMAELRDLSGLMLLEVLRRNYGSASDYSTQYFEKVRQAATETADSATQKGLEGLLASRDSITALLAQGDPGSSAEIQALCSRTYEVTRQR